MSMQSIPRDRAPAVLLEQFYPIHYKAGMRVEDTLRSSQRISRQQAIILWLVHSAGDNNGNRMSRKAVEAALTDWYAITSSAVSKAVRGLARPPLSLVRLREHPSSGREKELVLTADGQAFVRDMVANGTALTRWFLSRLDSLDVDRCIYIYYRCCEVFEELEAAGDQPLPPIDRSRPLTLPKVNPADGPRLQLEVFFPIHYKAGMVVETSLLAGGALDRQQAIILWLIRSIGEDGRVLRRKDIETTMTDWYEITSSALSQALRAMAREPLRLLTIEESPESGREKRVRLTRRGERFVETMFASGEALCARIIERLTDEEVDMIIHIFRRTSEIFDAFPGPFRTAD